MYTAWATELDLDSVVHMQHRVTPFKVSLELGCTRGAFVPGLEGSWRCAPLTGKEGDVGAVCLTEGRIRDAPAPALRRIGGVVLHGGCYIPFCEKCCAGHLGYDQWGDLPVGQDHELCCPWRTG